MEGRTKVTKEVLCEESRFILANVMAEARYGGRQNSYDEIRRMCEGAVSIPFSEYITFLEAAGYLTHDRNAETLSVTGQGEDIVNGGSLNELTQAAVVHFKSRAERRSRKEVSRVSPAPGGSSVSQLSGANPRPAYGESRSSELLDSRYEKIKTIGSGGIGSVYCAKQLPLDRQVALKEVREIFNLFADDQRGEIVRRFADVVRAHANLTHPHILPIHDVNLEREYPYVVSELAPNGSARRLIADAEDLPVGMAVKYLIQSLHALRAAHSNKVFHRGLKPENMLIDAYGNLKLCDFGFAKIVERDAAVIKQVYVGTGTVAYMAPELFNDPTGADAQADIYALGIIFYELVARRLPGRRSPLPSELNSSLPKGLDDIFDRMTRDAKAERYTTVDDILDDFEKLTGLDAVLDHQTQVLAADNPMEKITFRAGTESPIAADEGGDAKRRPYSYQQRNKKA